MIRIEILGDVIPAARPRFSGYRVYQSKRNTEYRHKIQSAAKSAMKDAAIALGYSNPAKALADHVPAKFKKIITRKQWQQMASNQETSKTLFSESTMGGVQRVTLINEAGLYKLIMRSKLPNAEKFSDWACGEVLPSIRKTGFYATQGKIDDIVRNPDRFIEELMSAYNRVKLERDAANGNF